MIWLIAKKDFLLNLISPRFLIGFILCLVVVPFTMIVSIDDYRNRVRIWQIDQAAAEQEQAEARVWSAVRPTVVAKPEILSVFSKGISPNVGNKVKIQLQQYPLFPSGHSTTRDNPLLNAFVSLDFATVIAILISLLALVFSYDSITREREDGTMKLALTGRLGRVSFLFGKFLGLLITLLPIVLFCYLLACLIALVNPGVSFSGRDWGGIGLLLFISLIYMIVFIVLGMFVSAMTRHSSSSIIVCLLSWIGFLFLIPGAATCLAQGISKTPLYDNVEKTIAEMHREYWDKYWDKSKEIEKNMELKRLWYWNYNGPNEDGYQELAGGVWEVTQHTMKVTEWSEPERLNLADRAWPLQQDYLDRLTRQQRLRQYLSWLSPSELFGQAADVLCRTDEQAFLDYMESLRDYRENFVRFFRERNVFSSYLWFTPQPEADFPTQQMWDEANKETRKIWDHSYDEYPPLDTSEVPRYVPARSTSLDTFRAALGRLAALMAIAILFFIGSIAVFVRYDVR